MWIQGCVSCVLFSAVSRRTVRSISQLICPNPVVPNLLSFPPTGECEFLLTFEIAFFLRFPASPPPIAPITTTLAYRRSLEYMRRQSDMSTCGKLHISIRVWTRVCLSQTNSRSKLEYFDYVSFENNASVWSVCLFVCLYVCMYVCNVMWCNVM